MSIHWPARVSLARIPTPLERLEDRGLPWGGEVWIKRDDLTGAALSGNKVRKLEWLCAEALAQDADTLVTCGGVNSNHARATAVAAARLGMQAHLLLRGEDRKPPAGNLLIDRFLGAQITFISAEQWPQRDALMQEIAGKATETGRRAYIIPEGGSNAMGSLGYAEAALELLIQASQQGLTVRRIYHACGSAGTAAGLALGMASAGRADIEINAVAVCNDAPYFDAQIQRIIDESVARDFVSQDVAKAARWRVLEGFKGEGYAKTTREEMKDHADLARRHGLFVDPVYTGKAMRAMREHGKQGALQEGATVFWHTGGIFELFAYADEISAL